MADSGCTFYNFNSAQLLATVIQIPEKDRGKWISQVALDLAQSDPDLAKTDYAKKLISEAVEYRERQAERGRKGGKASGESRRQKRDEAPLNDIEAPLAEDEANHSFNQQQSDNQKKNKENQSIIKKMSFDEFCGKWSNLIGVRFLKDQTTTQLLELYDNATNDNLKASILALETTEKPNHQYGAKVLNSEILKSRQ